MGHQVLNKFDEQVKLDSPNRAEKTCKIKPSLSRNSLNQVLGFMFCAMQ